MSTKINVIITPQMVYATYHQTICFEANLTEDSIMEAKSKAFNYGQYYGNCFLNIVEVEENWNSQDVFNYLEKAI